MRSQSGTEPEVVKLYFRIGEVARIVGVDPSAIRHWESEFRALRPSRSRSGQRLYTQADIRKIQRIKQLLHDEKYTTEGAVQHLRTAGVEPRHDKDPVLNSNQRLREVLLEIRQEITDFVASLDREADP